MEPWWGPGVMGGGTFPRARITKIVQRRGIDQVQDRYRGAGSPEPRGPWNITMVGPPTLEPRIYAPIPALLIGTMVKHPNPTGITPVYGAELMIMETIRKIACPNI